MPTTTRSHNSPAKTLAATGINGLDDVLSGGLTPNRLYAPEGVPGSGKTTLAVQFFMKGVRRGEAVLYVTLSKPEDELRGVTESHAWTLDGITIRGLALPERTLSTDDQYSMFHPLEIELGETIKIILADVERLKPARVVFGAHKRSLRDFQIANDGIHIGSPLRDFCGVLTSAPIQEQDGDNLREGNSP